MDPQEYSIMAHAEHKHWWFKGLRNLVLLSLKSRIKHNATILDAGCGTGENTGAIQTYLPSATVIGIDNNNIATSYAKIKVPGCITQGTINSLPIADSSVDAIINLDVIYHKEVDEQLALEEFTRVLKPSGILIMNLPAFEWLRTKHDIRIYTSHRYTTAEVKNITHQAGFNIINCYYRNSILFPLMVIDRFINKLAARYTRGSSTKLPWAPINYVFSIIIQFENTLIQFGIRFPVGGSVFSILKKPIDFDRKPS